MLAKPQPFASPTPAWPTKPEQWDQHFPTKIRPPRLASEVWRDLLERFVQGERANRIAKAIGETEARTNKALRIVRDLIAWEANRDLDIRRSRPIGYDGRSIRVLPGRKRKYPRISIGAPAWFQVSDNFVLAVCHDDDHNTIKALAAPDWHRLFRGYPDTKVRRFRRRRAAESSHMEVLRQMPDEPIRLLMLQRLQKMHRPGYFKPFWEFVEERLNFPGKIHLNAYLTECVWLYNHRHLDAQGGIDGRVAALLVLVERCDKEAKMRRSARRPARLGSKR